MYKGKKILGLICARGGSTGVPGKNIMDFFGKPMIGWAIEKLKSIAEIDRVVVNTDSEEIAGIARSFGADTPFLRPAHLAAKDTPMLPVIRHSLGELKEENYDCLILAQANSPLSEANDMKNGIHLLVDENMDVVFSVTPAGHPPQWTLDIEKGVPQYAFPGYALAAPACRQENKQLYRSTGAFSCAKTSHVLSDNPVQLCLPAKGQQSGVIITSKFSAVDIDEWDDLIIARAFYEMGDKGSKN